MTVADILEVLAEEGRTVLLEDEAKALLAAAGIPVTPCRAVYNAAEAMQAAEEFGYPVALKVRSTVITHKTEAGGVYLNLLDKAAVRRAYLKLLEEVWPVDPEAAATIQPMAPPGVEVLVGLTTDTQLGPVVALGLGGVLVEVLDDVVFRQAPLQEKDVRDMISSLKGSPLLKGYRGLAPVDIDALTETLLAVSRLAVDFPGIKEIDLNPVFAYAKGVLVVDARIFI